MASEKAQTQPTLWGEEAPANSRHVALADAPPKGGPELERTVPGRAKQETNRDFLDRTLQFWQPRSPQELTLEDARQIVDNISGFFRILAEWAAAAERKTKAPTHQPVASPRGADLA